MLSNDDLGKISEAGERRRRVQDGDVNSSIRRKWFCPEQQVAGTSLGVMSPWHKLQQSIASGDVYVVITPLTHSTVSFLSNMDHLPASVQRWIEGPIVRRNRSFGTSA